MLASKSQKKPDARQAVLEASGAFVRRIERDAKKQARSSSNSAATVRRRREPPAAAGSAANRRST